MDLPEVKQKSKDALEGVQNKQWKTRLNNLINVNGEYFVGD